MLHHNALLAVVLTALLFTTIAAAQDKLPLVIAHRGESHDAPENTLAAFDLAWKRGDDAVELDIHLTADGKVIVSHDDDTDRVTEKKSHLVIRESTADALRRLDVGRWKDQKFAGARLPLLSEVLAGAPAGKKVFIELKAKGLDVVKATVEVMKSANRPNADVPVISFHAESIAEFKRLWPDGPKAYLIAGFKQEYDSKKWSPDIASLIKDAKACNADGLDLQNKPPLDKAAIESIHKAGLTCVVWTEDDPTAARRYADEGIDGITTNRAQWLRQQLQART